MNTGLRLRCVRHLRNDGGMRTRTGDQIDVN